MAFAASTPASDLRVEQVRLNPGRSRYLALLAEHGAPVRSTHDGDSLGEPRGSIRIRGGHLKPLRLAGVDTVRCIDEIPALAAAWMASGAAFRVCDAAELRVKESDRIAKLAALAVAFGAAASERPDGLDIAAAPSLRPERFESGGDHRLAMAAAMLGLGTHGESRVAGTDCVRTSYPEFVADLARILRPARITAFHRRRSVGKRA